MKKAITLPLFALVSGGVAFVLRLLQNKTGFESNTGLPVAGHPASLALVVFLPAAAVILLLLSRRFPKQSDRTFPEDFSSAQTTMLTLPIMGILLMGVSGVLDAGAIFLPDVIPGDSSLSQSMQLIFAAAALLPAIALFLAAASCRIHDNPESDAPKTKIGTSLLVPPICLVIRLVLTYRIHSINPTLGAYYVELLALVFMTLAFYRLSSFAFQAGNSRRFILYSSIAIVLCVTTLADAGQPSRLLLYAGNALTLLGFVLLHLYNPPENAEISSN